MSYGSITPSALDAFTDDELRAELDGRMRRDAAYAARRAIANTCGPDSARTVPFDTGVDHRVETASAYLSAWVLR